MYLIRSWRSLVALAACLTSWHELVRPAVLVPCRRWPVALAARVRGWRGLVAEAFHLTSWRAAAGRLVPHGLARSVVAVAVLGAACSRPIAPLPAAAKPSPTPPPPLVLPRDAGPHDALTEWWYFTGHLRSDANGSLYGFEFTVFQVQRQGAPTGYLAHFAVSDIGGQRFSHQARTAQLDSPGPPIPADTAGGQPAPADTAGGPPSPAAALKPNGVTSREASPESSHGASQAASGGQSAAPFTLDVGGWSLSQDGAADLISADMQPGPGADPPFGLRLQLADEKPPALHNGGYIDYGVAGGSYYYSRTRLSVHGALSQAGGPATSVSGQAWMDHQWGNFVVAAVGGWDWYSLQLDDNTELMLYVLRAPSGETTGVYGTQVLADGTTRDLGAGSVRAEPTGSWTSPHTTSVYPSGWLLSLPGGERLELRPQLLDQELYFPDRGGQAVRPNGAAAGAAETAGVGENGVAGTAGAAETASTGGAAGATGVAGAAETAGAGGAAGAEGAAGTAVVPRTNDVAGAASAYVAAGAAPVTEANGAAGADAAAGAAPVTGANGAAGAAGANGVAGANGAAANGAPGAAVPAYWEGAVTVSGDRTGVGYVELTGYAAR